MLVTPHSFKKIMITQTIENASIFSEKCGRPQITKSAAEQNYVRTELKKSRLYQKDIAQKIGLNQGNLSRFLSGRQSLSDDSVEMLYATNIVARPTVEKLSAPAVVPTATTQTAVTIAPIQPASKTAAETLFDAVDTQAQEKSPATPMIQTPAKKAAAKPTMPPQQNWQRETKTVAEVVAEKGYSAATIRSYAKKGILNYTRKTATANINICVDEKYAALPETELFTLRKENAELRQHTFEFERIEMQAKIDKLEAENKKLREQNANPQQDTEIVEEYEEAVKDLNHVMKERDELKTKLAAANEKIAKYEKPVNTVNTDNTQTQFLHATQV